MTSEGDQKERLRAAIAAEEAGLADLEVRRATFERNLEALRKELLRAESATTRRHPPESPLASGPLDAAAKVALFRSLFRGREDVFPRLWVNLKTGKKGYAPATEFVDPSWAARKSLHY